MRWGTPHSRAFTMVELLSALAIIAVLVAVMVPAIGNYVETARKTADKQTLMVLNDALNRYKTQGGDLTALTAGASIGNVLSKMKTPVTWAGVSHKFLNEGVSYAGASLSAVGSGAQYRFTKYSDYADGTEYSNGIIDGYAANGYDVGDEEEFESWLAEAMSDTGSTNYLALENPETTDRIGFYARVATSGAKVRVWWGDGTTQDYNSISTSSNTTIAKVYGSLAKRTVVIVGDVSYIYSNNDTGLGGIGATAFGGNISTMPCLTYITVLGDNTLSGDITGINNLNYLYITGSNTITGDITNMPNLQYLYLTGNTTITGDISNSNLTYISIAGNNTLSGNVSNLNELTRLYIFGNNTLTGSISNLTNLNLLGIGGNNTITGAINSPQIHFIIAAGDSSLDLSSIISATENSKDMTTLNLANNNHPLTQIQVDTILENFWNNRDYPKARNERIINIGQASHAVPSAAGYAKKANLQAYHSPNNDSQYATWTVFTN